MELIRKNLEKSLECIRNILYSETFEAKGGANFIDGKKIKLKKSERKFEISFELTGNDRIYVNEILERDIHDFKLIDESKNTWHIPGKHALLSNVGEFNEMDFLVTGSIAQLSTTEIQNFDKKFHRVLIPIQEAYKFSFYDYQHTHFTSDTNAKNHELIVIHIRDFTFHLFTFKIDGKTFYGIDSLQPCLFKKFQEMAFAIFNAVGFIEGDLHLSEAYYLSSESQDFNAKLELFYTSMRESILTGYSIITTNPYSVLSFYLKRKGETLNHEEIRKEWYPKLLLIQSKFLSSLAELFDKHDALSRASLIVLEANLQPLELKAASYCVAYEAICQTIKNVFGIKSPNVIETKVWDDIIKPEFAALLKKLNESKKIDEEQLRILTNKLNNWNQPTNRDTLLEPFKGRYELKQYEIDCIDKRNRFLHGSLPVNEKNEDEAYKELYYIAIVIHKLIYILMLKLAGYDGYIKNYPKIHEYMTERTLEEAVFVKI